MTPLKSALPLSRSPTRTSKTTREGGEEKKKKKGTPIAKEIPKAAATAVAPANKQTSLLSPISLPGTRYL